MSLSIKIIINTKKVHDIQALFSLFESELGRDFGHNLDGLADMLGDMDDLTIEITDRDEFLKVFDREATKGYFGSRYIEDMPTLGEILLEIFEEAATLDFEVSA